MKRAQEKMLKSVKGRNVRLRETETETQRNGLGTRQYLEKKE